MVSSDYFAYSGHHYLVVVDRYSGWPLVIRSKDETADELVRVLRGYFCLYGAPEILSTDGAAVYMSEKVRKFLKTWGVFHRVSSAYFPHSNMRAETAVKSMKRLIVSNTGPGGSLENDKFAAAILQYRNTPDRDTGLSPAQVLYARKLRDTVPCMPTELRLRPDWVLTKERRELALAKRHRMRESDLTLSTKELEPLLVGNVVSVQNQQGPHKNKWELSGVVVEVLGNDSYMVRLDGSGRISKRNRRFLRPVKMYKDILETAENSGREREQDSARARLQDNNKVKDTGKSRSIVRVESRVG